MMELSLSLTQFDTPPFPVAATEGGIAVQPDTYGRRVPVPWNVTTSVVDAVVMDLYVHPSGLSIVVVAAVLVMVPLRQLGNPSGMVAVPAAVKMLFLSGYAVPPV